MNRTYKLHELIEMAKSGKKFEAKSEGKTLTQEIILNPLSSITADWTVTFKREPRVIWVPITMDGHMIDCWFNSEKVANEHFHNGSIKFVEVIEGE